MEGWLLNDQGFTEEFNVKSGVKIGAWDSTKERNMSQEISEGEFLVCAFVACYVFWDSNALKEKKEDFFENIVVLNLSLNYECNWRVVILLTFLKRNCSLTRLPRLTFGYRSDVKSFI